jgi:hypothetical protein
LSNAGDFSLDRALASFAAIAREFPEFLTGPPLIVRKVNRSRGWAPLYQILSRPSRNQTGRGHTTPSAADDLPIHIRPYVPAGAGEKKEPSGSSR